jgi:hypothetical protein
VREQRAEQTGAMSRQMANPKTNARGNSLFVRIPILYARWRRKEYRRSLCYSGGLRAQEHAGAGSGEFSDKGFGIAPGEGGGIDFGG